MRFRPDYQQRKPPRFAYLRSFLPLLVLFLLFSFLLSSVALLSHFKSPAAKQRLGWQSWDIVDVSSFKEAATEDDNSTDSDWYDSWVPSIPLDDWDPLAIHTTGISETAVKPCYFPPSLFPSMCAPDSTPEEDKAKGKWVVIPKDLNIKSGLWYLNVYYRRTRRLDVPLITSLRVAPEPLPETLQTELEGWTKATGDMHSGVWPSQPDLRLYYRTRTQGRTPLRQEENAEEFITELDVVFGDDEPFFGFERVQGGKVLEGKEGKWESVDLAYRRGNTRLPRVKAPNFHDDGTLKIMQIADLHYSVGTGKCRDTDKTPCSGDPDTAAWLAEALDAEKPDLVVFSGDQLNGQSTSYDSRSVLAKFARPVIERQIPWTAIFGNHDSEIADDRAEQMRTLENMPYSLAKSGPKSVDGVGNYVIKLHSNDASHMHIFTLYFLDSGSYQKKTLPWVDADYDFIKSSQIDWFLNASASIKAIERPFQPDGTSDLGDIWSKRSGSSSGPARIPRQDSAKTLAKPNAMMWFHIPLPETYNYPDMSFDGDVLEMGTFDGSKGNSKHNSGMFYNGLKAALEGDGGTEGEGWLMDQQRTEVKVVGHGHTHNTDMCRRVDGIWICFDGGSSYSGYGQIGFDRRVRLYQLSAYGEKIETYKRTTSGDIIDREVLVGEGAPSVGD